MIVVQLQNFQQNLMTCLWYLGFDIIVTLHPFGPFKSTFAEDLSDFLVDFNRILRSSDWLEEVVYVEISLICSDKIFVVDCIKFSHLVQRVICWQRKRKHRLPSLGTSIWRNIASILAESVVCRYHKQKIFQIRLVGRSGPDRNLSFKAMPWTFAAAMHTLLIFLLSWKLMKGWCGKYYWGLSLVSFSSLFFYFADVSSVNIRVSGFFLAPP